jgi:hypothetical protein
MDEYEKRIREKVFASKILTDGEWVYLVGLFGLAKDHEELFAERERLRLALFEARPYVPEHHGPVQAKIAEALGPIHRQAKSG